MGISLKWYADKWLVGCSHYESYYSTASFTLLVSVHMFSFLRQTLVFPMADSLSWGMILIGFIYTYKTPPKGMKKKKKKNRKRMKKIRTQQSQTMPLRHIMSCCQRQIISLAVTMKATPKVLTQHRASEKAPRWHFENESFIFLCAHTCTHTHSIMILTGGGGFWVIILILVYTVLFCPRSGVPDSGEGDLLEGSNHVGVSSEWWQARGIICVRRLPMTPVASSHFPNMNFCSW